MKKNSFLKNIKKTLKYTKSVRKNMIGYATVVIIEAIIGAVLPLIYSKVILNMSNGIMDELLYSSILVLIIELVLYLMYFFKGCLYQKIYQNTLVNLQIAVAKETLKLETKEIDKESSGLFIDRLNKDTEEISSMFMDYTYNLSYVISNMGILFAIFILNKFVFVYALIVAVIMYFINKKGISKRYKIQREVKKLKERKTGLTSELVRGIRDIKVLNANNTVIEQTSNKIIEASNEEIKMMRIQKLYYYIENNIGAASEFLFIILCIFLYNKNLITISTFIILYNYQMKVAGLLTNISRITEFNKKFTVASDRIYEVIDDERFKKEKFGNIEVKKLNGNIKFDNVTFSYDTESVLKNMTFEINPNEKVAFVGKSGVGKTTIFNLITRLYHVNDGKVLLDNINIEDLTCDSIRNNISIITQTPYIFNFSIKNNLLLAKEDATMEDIRHACHLARIDDFIMNLPEQYDTILGENGIILSGGQKQRLAIARALLMKTEIILFDEATSALDNETQSEIQSAIDNLKGEYTILIVAHRLSTIIDSDKIFVVDNGKIIDSGTHKELLKNCELYKQLYNKDLKKIK